MWLVARLPSLELERRLTEFQLVSRPDGVVMGAVGFRVVGHHVLIHSESIYSLGQAGDFLPVLWERIQALARSHQVARFWMRAGAGEFWQKAGFRPATPNELTLLPPDFFVHQSDWLTLPRREEALLPEQLEKQFEALHQHELESAERLRRQGVVLKWLAGLIVIGFLGGTLLLLIKALRASGSRRRNRP